MTHFTEEQLKEIASYLGIEPPKTYKVRDGYVAEGSKVWWLGSNGPELVRAEGSDLKNLIEFPDVYQVQKPKYEIIVKYLD